MSLLRGVVFVDDDRMVNMIHQKLAQNVALADELEMFNSAEIALEYLSAIRDKSEFPQLILVDINMPGKDGHEFAKEVQQLKAFDSGETVVAFLTASKDMADIIKADNENVEFYYFKPLDKETLKKVLLDCFEIEI